VNSKFSFFVTLKVKFEEKEEAEEDSFPDLFKLDPEEE